MTAPLAAREPSPSLRERLSARARRAYDAELLRYLPAKDADGNVPRWDFVVPVRHGIGMLLDPAKLFFALPISVLWPAFSFIGPHSPPGTPAELAYHPPLLQVALATTFSFLISAIVLTAVARRLFRPQLQRMALETYNRHRWIGSRRMDAAIAEGLESIAPRGRLIDGTPRDG